jgi:hypothetical protein
MPRRPIPGFEGYEVAKDGKIWREGSEQPEEIDFPWFVAELPDCKGAVFVDAQEAAALVWIPPHDASGIFATLADVPGVNGRNPYVLAIADRLGVWHRAVLVCAGKRVEDFDILKKSSAIASGNIPDEMLIQEIVHKPLRSYYRSFQRATDVLNVDGKNFCILPGENGQRVAKKGDIVSFRYLISGNQRRIVRRTFKAETPPPTAVQPQRRRRKPKERIDVPSLEAEV